MAVHYNVLGIENLADGMFFPNCSLQLNFFKNCFDFIYLFIFRFFSPIYFY